jgi:cytoskeletal protein RodZ
VTDEVHKLGEVLRAARESKGVDLPRVERETKIRERYLSALERGEYRELPGSVYTRGFLRNYGAYLGLDPEYLIDLYRLETSSSPVERPRMPSPPKPLATRRSRGFVVTPGVVVAAILTVLVGGFVAYLGFEFVNFARTPELRIIEPAGNISSHTEMTITVRGVTAPNASVTVSNLTENPTVIADAAGEFVVTVELLPGSNVMRLIAEDPVTGRSSEVEERTIVVVSDVPSPSPNVGLAVSEPAVDATSTGAVAIRGTSTANTAVDVTATLVTPPEPTFEVTSASGAPIDVEIASPAAPEPLSLDADGNGAFAGELQLGAGAWDVTLASAAGERVTRRVTVAPGEELTATLEISGGESYLVLEEDGEVVDEVSGLVAPEGDVIDLSADETLRIRVGNAGAVRITINGIDIGLMGGDAEVVEWRVTRLEG